MEYVLLNALSLGLIWSIMTMGVYITYRVLDVADLSVEGTITLGAAVCARLMDLGLNPYLSLLLCLAAGALAGLVTGLLHTKLRIPALLSGILTMIALYSVNLKIMGVANLPLLRIPTVFSMVGGLLGLSKALATILLSGVLALGLAFALYWFFGTQIGSAIRATGNNPHMVRAQGVNTDTTLILGLMLSNALVAFSGGLIAQDQGFADVQMGIGAIVIGLASLIIGEVVLGQRHFMARLISLIIGAILYRLIIAMVLRMGMPADDLKLFTAITVALALSLPRLQTLWAKNGASARGGK
ncbi:MAG TPA: ABC transporter permease [Clostridia bacterium]|jgi:putative ABC transport system permease protein|nr:ABC transporter permease [Clostridia bacterium]HPY93841.1 ABC transporter permease [Clostridia bacterium]HQA97313.1 ABC transporter permease [Clostridia bacterium]HUM59894.1 ABC transporter permease [Clostridia bacterium]